MSLIERLADVDIKIVQSNEVFPSELDALISVREELIYESQLAVANELKRFFGERVFYTGSIKEHPTWLDGKQIPPPQEINELFVYGAYLDAQCCVEGQVGYLFRQGYEKFSLIEDISLHLPEGNFN